MSPEDHVPDLGSATVVITPEFTKNFEDMVREIVVDEVTKQLDLIALRITEAITVQSEHLRHVLGEISSIV